MNRPVTTTRTLPVRNLSPEECRRLCVHSHEASSDRHKAYYVVGFGKGLLDKDTEDRILRLIKEGI